MNLKNLTFTSIVSISILVLITSVKIYKSEIPLIYNLTHIFNGGDVQNPIPLEMYENLEKYSEKYEIPKHVFYNIAYLETRYRGPFDWNYNPKRTSSAGALGPMQIMPSTANYICKENISNEKLKNDIELNISISAMLLKKLHNKYKNWKLVCGYYNTGRPIINKYAEFCATNKDYQENWLEP